MRPTKYVDDALFLLANPHLIRWVPHGLQIQPNRAYRARWFHDLDLDIILDIGANVGQAAINFCSLFGKTQVHSFEPIPDCFDKLKTVAAAFPNLTIHNYALGNETGQISFHQNSYSPASSILEMSDQHVESYPNTLKSSSITVPIKRLDDVASELRLSGCMLVKIDVQGYENNVIAGGETVIKQAKVIVVEASIRSLYKGDSSFDTIYRTLTSFGFSYYGSLEQLTDTKTGAFLQQDAIFVKG